MWIRRWLVLALAVSPLAACTTGKESNLPPTAVIAGPGSVRIDGIAGFDGSASSDPDGVVKSWSFDFGDGSPSATGSSAYVSHAWTAPGTYVVTLTVADDHGAPSVATRQILITPNARPTATIAGPSAGRVHRSLAFSAAGSADSDGIIASYSFDFGDQVTSTAGLAVQHVYDQPGTYTVAVTITDNDGAQAQSAMQIAVAGDIAPIASFTSPAAALVGESAGFDGSGSIDSDGLVASYAWDFGDGNTSTLAAPVHAYGENGTFTVMLTVTDDEKKTSSMSRQITVHTGAMANMPPMPAFTSPATVRIKGSASFDASSTTTDAGVLSYAWDFGDGSTATGMAVVHSYASAAAFTVKMTATATYTDGSKNTSFTTRTLQVTPNQLPVASLQGPGTGTTTQVLTYNGSGSMDPDGRIASWSWSFGDGSSASGAIVNHAWTAPGSFLVTVTVTDDDGAQSSLSEQVTLFTTPPPGVTGPTAALHGQTTALVDQLVTFDATGSQGGSGVIQTYAFDFGDGAAASGNAITRNHTYASAGTFTVSVAVTAQLSDGTRLTNTVAREITVMSGGVVVTSLSPPSGGIFGGTRVLISGNGFAASATSVGFGSAPGRDVDVLDPEHLLVTAPAGDPGSVTVRVSVAGNTGTLLNGWAWAGASNAADSSFCWIDATANGTPVGFQSSEDDASRAVAVPFDVPFFDALFAAGSPFHVTSNGWASFSDLTAQFATPFSLPSGGPANLIAAWFQDQRVGAGKISSIVTGAAPNRRFTVEWDGVSDATSPAQYRYEMSLFEGSGDVKLQYRNGDLQDGSSALQRAIAGIQNGDRTLGGSIGGHGDAIPGMAPGGLALAFTRRAGGAVGPYDAQQDRTLNVWRTNLPSQTGLDLPVVPTNIGGVFAAFTRPVDPASVVNGVTLSEHLEGSATATFPLETALGGSRDTVVAGFGNVLLANHTYTVTIGANPFAAGPVDPLGNPLSQDPMGVSCGADSPTPFRASFRAMWSPATAATNFFGTSTQRLVVWPDGSTMFATGSGPDDVVALSLQFGGSGSETSTLKHDGYDLAATSTQSPATAR